MEEASVAGESPDRSKQRESSEEPTSGSASPVPEARSEARDPRLAVAQESAAPKRGGVDTATKVLSVRDVRDVQEPVTDDEEAPEAEETASEESEGSEGSEDATAPEGADEATEDGDDASDGPADDSDEAEGDTGEAAGNSGGDARRAAVDSWVVTAEDAAARNGAKTGSGDDAEGGPEDDTEGDAEGGSGGGSGGGKEAEDADRAVDPGKAEEETAAANNDADDAGDSKDSDSSESAAERAEDTDEAPEAAEEPEAADEASGTDGDEPSDATPDPEPEPTDAEPTDAEPAADEAEDEDEGEPEPKGKPAPTPTPAAKPTPPAAVDHPTTIFKAPRPPKPPVDQPTTMLKAPRPAKSPAPSTPPPAPPAHDPERTSRFVALKPLDEPTAPPARTPGGPGVLPPAERTTQQPLPPKPPLDLLAELTNTPPPPPSPLRTLLRRVKIWTPLVLLLAVAFAIVQAVRPLPTPSLALTADDSYTFDGAKVSLPWPNEGQGWMDVDGIGTMSSFGKTTPVAIGSVAKAMTAYIVLKDHPMKSGANGPAITVDAKAEKEGGYDKDGESTLNTVKTGDKLTEKDALSAIMIPSANNIARLLARWDAGSEAAFVKKMNATAKELGMTNTTYTDPSGLIETTVSTAEDQVKLGNALVKIPALTDITKLPSWKDPSGQVWQNYNRLVPYNGAIGIKTGTTTKAGGNLLFAATKEVGGETVTVVGAILGQHTAPIIDTVNNVSKTAMLGAQSKLTSAKILKKGDVVGYVDDQLGTHTPVVVTKDVTAVGWAGLKVKLSFDAEDLPHSAKAGTKVGTLTVGDGDSGAVKVPVALQNDLTEPGFGAKLTRVS
ncbi:D-alanyl-D-alanine carboxypeptidase family protein [Streptomyces sp. YIM S03343]